MATKKHDAPMAALGSYDCVLPFQAIGIEAVVIDPENKSSVPHVLSKFSHDGYAVVFMEESLYADFMNDVDAINASEELSVIPIPDQSGSLGIGVESIRRSAERAVGMDIFNVQ